MSYTFYKMLHVVSALAVVLALGGIVVQALSVGANARGRKVLMIMHGLGLVGLLIAGFGMLAKQQTAWSAGGWTGMKTWIWLAMGGLPALVYRTRMLGYLWLLVV